MPDTSAAPERELPVDPNWQPSPRPTGITCLVTIHGIGFQQPPIDEKGVSGYADGLHSSLTRYLGSTLNDDPNRAKARKQKGEVGPVYVSSSWPPGSDNVEEGLKRLGTWDSSQKSPKIDRTNAPLGGSDGVSHVALVYARLQDQVPRPGSAIQAAARAAVSFSHYASLRSAAHVLLEDAWALLHHPSPGPATAGQSTGLLVRTDVSLPTRHPLEGMFHRGAPGVDGTSGLVSVLRTLEEDVCAYVARNDLRERVRDFVREALLRLSARDDVAQIVINSHSQGTIVAFDVLRELGNAASKVVWLFTFGSPLRKYTDLFSWGNEIGGVQAIPRWTNVWDPRDPVADPLQPAQDWQPGTDAAVTPGTAGLYRALNPDTGQLLNAQVEDTAVDNLAKSRGGSLQAHNYWDNDLQVVEPMAKILKNLVDFGAPPPLHRVAVRSGVPGNP